MRRKGNYCQTKFSKVFCLVVWWSLGSLALCLCFIASTVCNSAVTTNIESSGSGTPNMVSCPLTTDFLLLKVSAVQVDLEQKST